jgi:hypothetical protein
VAPVLAQDGDGDVEREGGMRGLEYEAEEVGGAEGVLCGQVRRRGVVIARRG